LKKDRTPIVPKKLIIPFTLVTSLFALWGFANAITDPMVQAFKKVLELSNSEAAWIQMAFYGGYFCMALPAALFIKKYSYKKGILVGLLLYSIGALLFYPAAVTEQFWFFCLGLYILTFGLAFLETTANPYILSMGNSKTAIQRLNLAQLFNPLGLIGGLIIAQQFILKNLKSDDINDFSSLEETSKIVIRASDLIVIRDPYVVLGLFIIVMFFIVLFSQMPETKNNDRVNDLNKTIINLIKNHIYVGGVIAQTLYVGAQIMCWTYIYQYSEALGINSEEAASYQFIAFVLFFLGRGTGTLLLKYFNSKNLMLIFATMASLFSLGAIFNEGYLGLYCLISISFFMSIMFPTIYGLSLKGLNEVECKIGAAGLVMAIVGGALMPTLQGMIIDIGGVNVNDIQIFGVSEVNFSFILPFFCFLYIISYSKIIVK